MLTCKVYINESTPAEIFLKIFKLFEYFVSIYVPEPSFIYSEIINVVLNRKKFLTSQIYTDRLQFSGYRRYCLTLLQILG
jgi:hypothetical protein